MAIESHITPDYSVTTDDTNKSVWVNGNINCLGRFTPLGYEVYRKFAAEPEITNQTLECKIGNLTPDVWLEFVNQMDRHHGIDLSDVNNPLF